MSISELTQKRSEGFLWHRILWISVLVLVLYLVLVPLGMLLFASLRSTGDRLPFEAGAFTLSNYIQVFCSRVSYELLAKSLWYAIGSVSLGLTLAAAFAWLLERTNLPARRVFNVLLLSPMAIPPMVQAMGWILLANPHNGVINLMLRSSLGLGGENGPLNIYSIPGMIWVTGLTMVPSIYLMIGGTFRRMDPSLVEASNVGGVRPFMTLRRISLPLLSPGLLAAATYYFVIALEIWDVAAVLGLPKGILVFSTLIFEAAHPTAGLPDYGQASGYATVFLLISGAFLYLYTKVTRHQGRFVSITGRGYRPTLIDIGPWRYYIVASFLTYFFVTVILPLLILLWASLLPSYYSVPSLDSLGRLSLANYIGLISFPGIGRAFLNSFFIAFITATTVTILASIVSWLAVRGRFAGHALADRATFLVVSVPSVVVALSLIFVYLSLPLQIYGTVWIIIVAYVTRYLAYSTRLMNSAYLQVHPELEEASYVHGVPWLRTLAFVIIPLIFPSVVRGWLWVFVHSLREAPMAVMLSAAGSQTLAVMLWILWAQEAEIPLAASLCILLTLMSVSLIAMLLLRRDILGDMEGRG